LFGSDLLHFFNFGDNQSISLISNSEGIGSMANLLWIAPAWSLGLEITYYLVVPLVSRLNFEILMFITFLFFTIRFIAHIFGFNNDPWSYRLILFEIPIFLLGSILARLRLRMNSQLRLRFLPSGFVVFVVFVFTGYINFYFSPPRYLVLPFLITTSALVMVLGNESSFSRYLGDISYPLYLLHLPLMVLILSSREIHNFPNLIKYSILFLIVHLISAVILFAVRPVDIARRNLRRKNARTIHKSA
jgi:peptidoglycan/LPS O-acetylase OafA/YrhL